jgi:hypothetical protein
MESNKDIKLKITHIVTKWELDNPTEFSLFLQSRKAKTDDLKNKFAELKGHNFILRLLYEIPEGLDTSLRFGLDSFEMEFLKSTPGALWFAKTFKQYNVSQKT